MTANSTDPYNLLIESTSGEFFDRQRRETYRAEWQELFQHGLAGKLGSHEFKAGYNPRTVIMTAGLSFRLSLSLAPPGSRWSVSALGRPPDSRSGRMNSPGCRDKWTPFSRLTVDLGLRSDWDSVTGSTHAAPRAGFALRLTKDAKTVLKGGSGFFYDRVPLNIASFPFLPGRTVSAIGPAGDWLSTGNFANMITAGLRNPRTVSWNLEFDREVTSNLLVRGSYQQRNTVRDFVLEAQPRPDAISLSNRGRGFYREFQLTGRYKIRRATVNASYVRSKAEGNLNDFNQFFGNNAVAVIQPDERGQLPFDAPNRFLAWGEWQAPFQLTLLPVLDVHTGFPWSEINQERKFVGPRNSERFPRFTSFDLQVTRRISLPLPHERLKARVGFSVFNLFNQFNPRDVQGDVDSLRYRALFNGVGRTFRGKFILEF